MELEWEWDSLQIIQEMSDEDMDQDPNSGGDNTTEILTPQDGSISLAWVEPPNLE